MSQIESDIRKLIDSYKTEAQLDSANEAEVEAAAIVAGLTPPEASDIVEVNPGVVEIARQLALIKIQKSAFEAVEKNLSSVLKTLTDGHDGIRHGSQIIARISRSTVTRVNTEAIKEQFPYDQYPALYTVSEGESRLLIDPTFKRSALASDDSGGAGGNSVTQ